MGVILQSSVEEFFQGALVEAMQRSGVAASPPTEYYLVGLLTEFTRARIGDRALALKLAEADDPGERVKALKEVGDTSLYMSGFFSESLAGKLVQVDYYMDLGEAAYRELAGRLGSSSVREVYKELSAKFPRFVDVLLEVRSRVNFAGDDVARLYKEWQRTRADWIEARLRSLGVIVVGDDDDGMLQ